MAKKGFFILTDISGYTEFLTKSELDHAQDALQALFDVQLANIKHPFVISGFRGDAIFLYVPETNFCTPQTLLESLENLYFVFDLSYCHDECSSKSRVKHLFFKTHKKTK